MNNIFKNIPKEVPEEVFDRILKSENVSIERIVSQGQSTTSGEWLSQDKNEWVILLQGGAIVLFEDTLKQCVLNPGDYIYIYKKRRHRVESTLESEKTVWLAVHF